MKVSTTRRGFLTTTAASGAYAALGDFGFLGKLPKVSAASARLAPESVQFDDHIEPLVRLLEETPRERLLEEVAARVQRGTSYRELLAALLLAGIRNVQPRPHVGFKFHSVLVVNSAHLASQASPDSDRWLPIFWAIDYFKSSQARDVREGDWTMAAVDESRVPLGAAAEKAFTEALDAWDVEAADVAAAGVARSLGAHRVFEILYRYGARDFRDIGHKAIYVANAERTLGCIGWQHGEPVVRSLAYAMLAHDESGNPSEADFRADRPWRSNLELSQQIDSEWRAGKTDENASQELFTAFRTVDAADAAQLTVELLNRGVSATSIMDAVFAASSELLMRKPGIVPLHAVTTTNALHHAFRSSGIDETRRMLLLQCVSFVPLVREAMNLDGGNEARFDTLEPATLDSSGETALAEIFSHMPDDRTVAAKKALSYLEGGGRPVDLIRAARRLVFLKGNDAHDYKYSSAVLEDSYHISPKYQNAYLAAAMFQLNGAGERDNQLVERTRAALGA